MAIASSIVGRRGLGRLRSAGLTDVGFWSFPLLLTAILLLIASFDFVIFHTLAELFAISVALVMFALAWHTRDFTSNHFLLFLACGYFWVGVLDLAHTLSYRGLELLPGSGANLSSQFWIVTRFYEASLLFLAPLLAGRRLASEWLFGVNALAAVTLAALVLGDLLPETYRDGSGLTEFKVYAEYAIIALLGGAVVALLRQRGLIGRDQVTMMIASIVLTAAAEVSFTVYLDPHGLANLVGHVFKLFSFWVIFQAVVASNLRKPYVDLQEAVAAARLSRQAAERASRAKSDFLSMMSHDLRTPLNAIVGFSEMMRLQALGPLGNPRYVEYTEAIRKSGAQLVSLINDVLDVSRIESGSYALDEEPIAIRELLSEVYVGLDCDAPLGRNSIRLDIPDGAPCVLAERRALTQIVTNLISNATKFSDPGSEIVVSWGPAGEGRWALGVHDRGCGIPADRIGRVTEPFVQGNPHLSRRHGGIGLGLHIVRLLTELHRAELRIQSAEGQGTSVHVLFPPDRILPEAETRPSAGEPDPAVTAGSGNG